jgi:acyl-CoA synthetase (AMP-forming)/AMP-acid ligase II
MELACHRSFLVQQTMLTKAGNLLKYALIIASCAAVGFPDPALGEDIAVFIVADRPLTEDFVLARAQVVLPAGKRPSRVVFLEELPLNANGKVLKKDLREMLTAAP